jgi:hypothetical protein
MVFDYPHKIRMGRDSSQRLAQSGHNQPLVFPYKVVVEFSESASAPQFVGL